MRLRELVRGVEDACVEGDGDVIVEDLVARHDAVRPGTAFVAIRGVRFDGHDFIPDVIRRGASVLIVESKAPQIEGPAWVVVKDTRRALSAIAGNFCRHPWRELALVGITGTNGKTSTAYLVQRVLETDGRLTARFGTIGHEIGPEHIKATTTTPDALELNRLLQRAVGAGAGAAVMEVSSHALATHRVEGVQFDAAVWTNLTQDHLDFHRTMESYRETKARLFDQLKPHGVAILNRDDPAYEFFANRLRERPDVRTLTFGVHTGADVQAEGIVTTATETAFEIVWDRQRIPVRLSLLGDYNVSNALAAAAVGFGLQIAPETVRAGLESLKRVPGRFEPVDEGQPFGVVVDYAHTPDALEHLIRAARRLKPARLLVVFGCGGDRDRGKRPLMGRIAAELSDLAIVTSDNPRTEDPQAIIAEVCAGIPDGIRYETIPDRGQAIARAVRLARKGDLVLIAGKGHEDYQTIGTKNIHFDDREVARAALRQRFSAG